MKPSLVTWFAPMKVFYNKAIIIKYSRGGGLGVCKTVSLVPFAAMEEFLNEEILPNYRQGEGPEICKTFQWKCSLMKTYSLSRVREEVLEFARLSLYIYVAALEHFSHKAILND